jgi:hypothetical protein
MSNSNVLVIGGDGRRSPSSLLYIRFVPSSRNGGPARIHHAVAAIRSGAVDVVVLLTRWLGHSEYHLIVRTCRAANVRFIIASRSIASALRAIGAAL